MRNSKKGKISIKLILILMIPIIGILYLAANGPSYDEIVADNNSTTFSK